MKIKMFEAKYFYFYFTAEWVHVPISDLIGLSNSDSFCPVNKTHIDVLAKEFKERPASNFTVMVVNIPHFKPKDRHIEYDKWGLQV